MPKILFLLVCIFSAAAGAEQPIKVSYDQVVDRVSKENLVVYQNALKVYQAKKSISVARGNLLPKLNIWRLISVAFDPLAAVGLVEDIAPFLIPANWFQLRAQKELYAAEVDGYKALWANEVMTAKSVYMNLQFDQTLLSHIEAGIADLQNILVLAQTRETLGGAPQSLTREIEYRILALAEDKRFLKILLEDEMSLLSQMLGYSTTTNLELEKVGLPDFESYPRLDYVDYEARVLSFSPEIRQFTFLENASKYVRKVAMFSLFGVGTLARGVAGGIFDNVPIQDGLGFGTPASIKIAKNQTEMIKLQKQGTQETIKRQLRLIVVNYNLGIENFAGVKRRRILAREINEQLYERLSLGQDVETIELLEASKNTIQSTTSLVNAQIRFAVNQDKLSRLLFEGDYSRDPLKK